MIPPRSVTPWQWRYAFSLTGLKRHTGGLISELNGWPTYPSRGRSRRIGYAERPSAEGRSDWLDLLRKNPPESSILYLNPVLSWHTLTPFICPECWGSSSVAVRKFRFFIRSRLTSLNGNLNTRRVIATKRPRREK